MTSDKTLKHIGFDFPETKEQLDSLRKLMEDYKFKGRVKEVNPERIVESLRDKARTKIKPADYFKRVVIAAEIVSQLSHDSSMGHVKLEKMIYLCKNFMGMQIQADFAKHQMGPYDPKLRRSIDSQFLSRKWFKYDRYSKIKYVPLSKAGEHEELLNKYYAKDKGNLDSIITLFGRFRVDQIELVVTIYDCWLRLIKEGEKVSDELLITMVRSWSDHKKVFEEERIQRAIGWMKEKGVVPANKK